MHIQGRSYIHNNNKKGCREVSGHLQEVKDHGQRCAGVRPRPRERQGVRRHLRQHGAALAQLVDDPDADARRRQRLRHPHLGVIRARHGKLLRDV